MTHRFDGKARIIRAFEPSRRQDADRVQAMQSDDLARMERALATLPRLTRDIFLANRRDGYDYDDISALMGIGRRRVERHMVKALVHLDRFMNGNERTSLERWWQAFSSRWCRNGSS